MHHSESSTLTRSRRRLLSAATLTRPGILAAVVLSAITLVAAFYRFWQLDLTPPGFHWDEAYEALEAWRVLIQPGYHPIFFTGNFGVDPAFIYLTSLAFRLFGVAPVVMRGVAALAGTLTVLAVYGLGRELTLADHRVPRATPWMAALVLAIMRWHIHYSRVGIEPILVPLALVICMWALWRAIRTRRLSDWLLFGVITGLSPYTYPAGRLLPILAAMLACTLPLAWWLQLRADEGVRAPAQQGFGPRVRDALRALPWAGLLVAGLAAFLVALPLGLYFSQHLDQLLLRSSQIAVSPDAGERGGLLPNLVSTLGMFTVRGDVDPRNNLPGAPVFGLPAGLVFYLGAAFCIWNWRRPVFGGLLLAGAVMLLPTILSEYAPHFRRVIGASPVVALMAGMGLAIVWDVGQRLLARIPAQAGRLRPALRALPALVVALVLSQTAVASARDYFGAWGPSPALYHAFDEGLWDIGRYIESLPPNEVVCLSPRPAGDMTLAFALRRGRPMRHFDGRSGFLVPAATLEGQPTTYIFIDHEDFRGARVLRDLYPQVEESRRFLDRSGRVYARALRVPLGAAMQRGPRYPETASAPLARWPDADLLGYDLHQQVRSGANLVWVQWWWKATGQANAHDWTVFTHLLGPPHPKGGVVWAAGDSQPGKGSLPFPTWMRGDLILDEHLLVLPPGAPPVRYQIEVGLYSLARQGARANTLDPVAQDFVIAGTVGIQ